LPSLPGIFVYCVETAKYMAIVVLECESETVISKLSNGTIFTWVTPNLEFKVTSLLDVEYLRNSKTDIVTMEYWWDLHTPYSSQRRYFEWPWTTLSDLAKVLTMRSIAQRSLSAIA